MQSVLTFLSSVSFFMVFKNLDIGHNKRINTVASATFGVYLIHDNGIMRSFLWDTVFRNSAYQNTVMLIPYSIGAVCLVYVACTVADLLRQATVERVFLYLADRCTGTVLKPFAAIVAYWKKLLFGNQEG